MNPLLLAGLQNEATIVRTPSFAHITAQLAYATAHHAIMVVAGEHGTGKRLALLTCLTEQTLPHHVVPLPPSPSAKDMIRLLYEAVHAEDDVFALRDMQDALDETLSGSPRIIVVDRAHRLTAQAAEQLHYLHSRPGAAWTLVLLGGPDTIRAISTSAALRGDIVAAVEVKPLAAAEAVSTVRGMHPLLATADHALLETINNQLCKGLLKSWAVFLQGAIYLRNQAAENGTEAPLLDKDLARATIARMPRLRSGRIR